MFCPNVLLKHSYNKTQLPHPQNYNSIDREHLSGKGIDFFFFKLMTLECTYLVLHFLGDTQGEGNKTGLPIERRQAFWGGQGTQQTFPGDCGRTPRRPAPNPIRSDPRQPGSSVLRPAVQGVPGAPRSRAPRVHCGPGDARRSSLPTAELEPGGSLLHEGEAWPPRSEASERWSPRSNAKCTKSQSPQADKCSLLTPNHPLGWTLRVC